MATVVVGTCPNGVAITPDGAFAYVTNQNSGNVSVIRTSDNTVATTVPVGTYPHGVAITPDGAFGYVVNMWSHSVSVIRTSDNTVVTTVPVGATGTGPWWVAITPNGAFAYVTNWDSNDVKVIRTSDNTVVATVPVGTTATEVAITPDGAFAYVTNSGSGNVSVIRTSDNTVVNTIAVGTGPFGVAVGPTPRTVPFAAFDAKVEIELGPLANDDEFELKGTFTLGAASNGIDIPTEIVSLQLSGGSASFSVTIPAGSFTQDKKGRFKFEGVIDGVPLEAVIRPLVGGGFEFKAEGQGTDLIGIANPLTVSLTVGNDGGSTTVEAEFE